MKKLVAVGILVLFVNGFVLSGQAVGSSTRPDQPTHSPASIASCPIFPPNNVWNTRIDTLPVDSHSSTYINFIGPNTGLDHGFGAGSNGGPNGIPYNIVPGTQPLVSVTFMYATQSDPGPYPIPDNPAIEYGVNGTGDKHLLIVDRDKCKLFELWLATNVGGLWQAGSGAIWDLNSNAMRPSGWTSADAAGLPILPALLRYDEVQSGIIPHALRFTVRATNGQRIWPAQHLTSSPYDASAPPMGQRFRLKASFNISSYSPQVQTILTTLKTYGVFVADNGANSLFLTGAPDPRWNDLLLTQELTTVTAAQLEAVDESSLMISPGSFRSGAVSPLTRTFFLPYATR